MSRADGKRSKERKGRRTLRYVPSSFVFAAVIANVLTAGSSTCSGEGLVQPRWLPQTSVTAACRSALRQRSRSAGLEDKRERRFFEADGKAGIVGAVGTSKVETLRAAVSGAVDAPHELRSGRVRTTQWDKLYNKAVAGLDPDRVW
jgi:hypothetical protein